MGKKTKHNPPTMNIAISYPGAGDALANLRKGAPANTKLTISRGARLKKQRSANLYHGTGNMSHYIREAFPHLDHTDQRILRANIERYAEKENSGEYPRHSVMVALAEGLGQ